MTEIFKQFRLTTIQINSFIEKSYDYLDYSKQNTCFSPFSLYQSLMILMYAAPNDSAIKKLQDILEENQESIYEIYKNLQDDKSIKLASNIFDKYLQFVKESFSQLMLEKFGFKPEKLESVQQVNNWCSQHTNNKIQKIVDSINFDTLIISAIHFKGDWSKQFQQNLTQEKPFKTFQQEVKKMAMHQKFKHPKYFENGQFQMIKLNYQNSELDAVIILPKQNNQQAFKQCLIDGINNLYNLSKYNGEVVFEMPKFKIESSFALKDTLQKLGATQIFENIDCIQTLGKGMQVDEIIQKTFINVDEKGTEAAAVTGIMMRMTCTAMREIIVRMYCDHPFWFLLVDQENNVIFTSSIVE